MPDVRVRGRDADLSRISAVLDRSTQSSTGAVVVISGEPGIGKSTALRAVVEQATERGFSVGTGKTEHIDQIAPAAPLLVALRSGRRPLLDSAEFTALAALRNQQLWLVDRIAAQLEEAASTAPVLIAIDDIQWADRLTRFALRILPGRLAGSPVVWLLAARSHPAGTADEIMADARREHVAVDHVELDPLDPDAMAHLAHDHLGRPADDRTRRLLDSVDGNPFWAVEILDDVARGHRVDDATLPPGLMVRIHRRLRTLAPPVIDLLRLMAVWGRPMPTSTAAELLGTAPAVFETIRTAVAEGLVDEGPGTVTFRHDMLREAVYSGIAATERAALHRRCGRHLLTAGAGDLAAAPHFRAGAEIGDEEAAAVLLRAARAGVTSLPDTAAELAQEAFRLVPPDRPAWQEHGEECADILVTAQRPLDALELTDRLLAGTTDPESTARLQVVATRALLPTGRLVEAVRRIDDALSRSGVSDGLRARLTAARTLSAVRTAPPADLAIAARAALDGTRRLGDVMGERMALQALGELAKQEGRHQDSLEHFRSLRRLAGARYLAEEIRALQMLDRHDEAEEMIAEALRPGSGTGSSEMVPSLLQVHMWQAADLGLLDEIGSRATALLQLCDELGHAVSRLEAWMALSLVAMIRGDLGGAREVLRTAERSGVDADQGRGPDIRLMQGWLAVLEGDVRGGASILRALLVSARTSRSYWPWEAGWLPAIAQVGVAAADRAIAEEALAVSAAAAERNPTVATFRGLALHVRGIVAHDPAVLRMAVDVLRSGPRQILHANAASDLGAVLLGSGDRDEAVAVLRTASAVYRSIGADRGDSAVQAMLASTDARRPARAARRPDTGWAALTESETRVAELISAGHTNRSAARALTISPNTVGTHLRAVFTKLDVSSRVQLTNSLHARPVPPPEC